MARWTVSTMRTYLQGRSSTDEQNISEDVLPTSSSVRPGQSSRLHRDRIGVAIRSGRGRALPLAAGATLLSALCSVGLLEALSLS